MKIGFVIGFTTISLWGISALGAVYALTKERKELDRHESAILMLIPFIFLLILFRAL